MRDFTANLQLFLPLMFYQIPLATSESEGLYVKFTSVSCFDIFTRKLTNPFQSTGLLRVFKRYLEANVK